MRFLKSEAGTVVLWLLGTILLAATLFPWIHGFGQNLATEAATKDLSSFWESVGASAAKADLGTYFSRALYLAVLLSLPVLIFRLRKIRADRGADASAVSLLPPPAPWKTRAIHLVAAFALATILLWALGLGLEAAGAFSADASPPSISKVLRKSLIAAILAGIIEEWLFRGLLLGVWLRIAKPMSALLSVSFIFAVVHFLQPPADYPIANPSSPFAGFQLLEGILQHFLDPRFIAAELALLFVLGIVLGSNRLRTGSLCVPIGLHAGFVFAFKSFNLLYNNAETSLRPLWIGESLRSGLLPLATLILAGAICRFVFRSRKPSNNPPVSD